MICVYTVDHGSMSVQLIHSLSQKMGYAAHHHHPLESGTSSAAGAYLCSDSDKSYTSKQTLTQLSAAATQATPTLHSPHTDTSHIPSSLYPEARHHRDQEKAMCKVVPANTSSGRRAPSRPTQQTSSSHRRPLVGKGMQPSQHHQLPKATTSAKKTPQQMPKPGGQAPAAVVALSLGDLSKVLDPFFDTCLAVRQQRLQARERAAAAERDAVAHLRADAAFLSAMGEVDAEEASAGAGGAAGGFDALRDFLTCPGGSSWDMVQEMEAEKKDMLRSMEVRAT